MPHPCLRQPKLRILQARICLRRDRIVARLLGNLRVARFGLTTQLAPRDWVWSRQHEALLQPALVITLGLQGLAPQLAAGPTIGGFGEGYRREGNSKTQHRVLGCECSMSSCYTNSGLYSGNITSVRQQQTHRPINNYAAGDLSSSMPYHLSSSPPQPSPAQLRPREAFLDARGRVFSPGFAALGAARRSSCGRGHGCGRERESTVSGRVEFSERRCAWSGDERGSCHAGNEPAAACF